MSQNPYQASDPFGGFPDGPLQPQNGRTENPLQIPAIILIVLSSLWLLYGIGNLLWSFAVGPPQPPANQPPAFAFGQQVGFYATVLTIPIVSLVILVGGVCMLRLKGYAMALTGAVVGLAPLCGPCLILAIPFSIWALVLLLKPDIRARFV